MGKPARLASDRQVEVLHFPFMAVLSCIIGSLAFILFIFIAYSKDLVDNSQIEKEILGSRADLEQLRPETARLKERLKEDKQFLADKTVPPQKELLVRRAETSELREQVSKLQAEKEEIVARLGKLERSNNRLELEELRKKAALLKSSRSVAAMVKHASLPGLPRPVYIECRENEAVFWPAGVTVEVRQDASAAGSFDEWLAEHGLQVPGKYVVFLIRPSGITTFEPLRRLAESSGFKVGYEPVLPSWELFFG